MKLSQLGWVLAAGIVGVAAAGGFQVKPPMKVGYVDMPALYQDSNLKAKNDEKLQKLAASRQDTITFLGLYPSFSEKDLARFRTLSTKLDSLTPDETTELEKLKTTAKTATKQYDDLRQKQSPTADEIAILNDLGRRNDINNQARVKWANEFQQELAGDESDFNQKAIQQIKDSLAKIAKPQGYHIIFRENVAVYGSSSLGDAVKKDLDKNAK